MTDERFAAGCESCGAAEPPSGGLTRRRLLARGARFGALAGLAAAMRSLVGAAGALASTRERHEIVAVSKLKVGSVYAFGDPIAHVPAYLVQPKKGQYRAFSRICTHLGCEVNFSGGKFVCPCHGSEYSASTGSVLHGPARKSLPSYTVVEQGGKLYLES